MKADGVVLVTGGSRGIGRAIVERLTAGGCGVAFTWNTGGGLAREIEAETGRLARGYRLDLQDRTRIRELVSEVHDEQGEIVGLVNNAGIQHSELLALSSDETWDRVIDVNLSGAFRMSREAVRSMIHLRRGSIVNVASLSALHGFVGQSAYAASKAGMIALTRCLAREVGRFGIRVNAVVPGFVETGMTADLPEQAIARLRDGEVLRSGVSAADVAGTVEFLLSDAASSTTGQTIVVDAGTTA